VPTRLRVGLELTGLQLDATGSARYIQGLRGELERREQLEVVAIEHPGRRHAGAAGRLARGLTRELAWFPLGLPRRARALRLDVLHCPVALAPPRSPVPLVVTLHDAMAWDHPEWLTRGNAIQQRLALPRAVRRASAVLSPSEFTRSRVIELLDLEPDIVAVTPEGVDKRFCPGPGSDRLLRRLGIHQPYLLSVGALQPRKNLEAALRAFERLVRDGAEHRLVLAGGRGWSEAGLLRAAESSPAASRIVMTGRVADDDLIDLYRGADCFVFPSRYEGFGLPPLEAMACGAPVVCSDRTSLPEVVGDAALLVDPDDEQAIEGALAEVISSPQRRSELSARGRERAGLFTWSRCADLTCAAYERALARRAG
jgi:glycosyltransferase involved in cell wall biosynthesis